jgi:hypothetical protein
MAMDDLHHFVSGRKVEGKSGRFGPVFNPTTGEQAARVPLASAEEVREAVAAARQAFPEWAAQTPLARARVMFRYKELIESSELYRNEIRAGPYYSFAATSIFGMGLLFELPIVILALVRLGITSSVQLRRNRRIGLGLCVIAGVLLPGVDFVSTAIQTIPILLLFEMSIWVAAFFEKRWADQIAARREAFASSDH